MENDNPREAIFKEKPVFFSAYMTSLFSTNPRYQLGAVISKGSRIIASGANIYKTHPIIRRYHPHILLHAEINALLRAKTQSTSGSIIYVYRETKNHVPAIAMPCKICTKFLAGAKIKRAIFTIGLPPYYQELSLEALLDYYWKGKAIAF